MKGSIFNYTPAQEALNEARLNYRLARQKVLNLNWADKSDEAIKIIEECNEAERVLRAALEARKQERGY